MALVQTRRTVSFNREVYEAAKAEAKRVGVPLAKFVEDAIVSKIPAYAEHAAKVAELEQQLRDLRSKFSPAGSAPVPSRGRPLGETKLSQIVKLYENGTRPRDIADILGTTQNSVNSALSRARAEGRLTDEVLP